MQCVSQDFKSGGLFWRLRKQTATCHEHESNKQVDGQTDTTKPIIRQFDVNASQITLESLESHLKSVHSVKGFKENNRESS